MATLAQNESASLDTNYTQEFVDWASQRYGDKTQAMLTSAPSAREAAMEFVNERLKPEIMGDYRQGRSDLESGAEHEAFSGAHIVQPSSATYQQGASTAGSGEGVQYTPVDQGAGTHSTQAGTSQANPSLAGTMLHSASALNSNQSSQRAGDGDSTQLRSESHPSATSTSTPSLTGSLLSSSSALNSNQNSQRTSDGESTQLRGENYQTGNHQNPPAQQYGSQRPTVINTPETSATQVTGQHGGGSSVSVNPPSSSGSLASQPHGVISGGPMDSSQMERAFKENQTKLEQQANHGFEPKNTLQRQAAEQRSANEQKINESAGEINKNRSTVQTSSDILKGAQDNAKSNFATDMLKREKIKAWKMLQTY
ncbi:conjugal transfer mating pair stabilization protein TraG [Citrobacter amalonaticus]|nr:conjugal transfer mating pair stabilization protein TraG [Citrobacter amalonaticus]